jgi:hypothetical protein
MLRAAVTDAVLLAHAVTSQSHRQTEVVLFESMRASAVQQYGNQWVKISDLQDNLRQQVVSNAAGQVAFNQWQRDSELAQLGHGDAPVTVEEARQLAALFQQSMSRLATITMEREQGGNANPAWVDQQRTLAASDYQRKIMQLLGAARAALVR